MDHIGIEFWEKTKYKHLGQSDQQKGATQPKLQLDADSQAKLIDLPSIDQFQPQQDSLRTVIENRRSVRKFSKDPLSLPELSWLLWATQGVTMSVPHATGGYVTRRIVPSAGGRHAFETYLVINNVAGLAPGLYRFLAVEHKLVEVVPESAFAPKFVEACLSQNWMLNSAVIFAWVAVAERMTWRYNQRGYRYMLLDAGHVGQNLYLAAESINGGACGIAAYDDDLVNDLLGLDGESRFVIYIGTCGRRPG